MPEYKSADEIPLDAAVEAIMSGALRAVSAQQGADEVEGFVFEIIAGGRIGPRGGGPFKPPSAGTAAGPGGASGPGAGGQGPGGYGA